MSEVSALIKKADLITEQVTTAHIRGALVPLTLSWERKPNVNLSLSLSLSLSL